MNNKTLRIVLDLVLIVVGIVFLIFGIKDAYNFSKENTTPDNVRFRKSYRSAPDDNIYKYVSIDEADRILKSKTGLIFVAKTDNPWAQVMAPPLNDVAKKHIDTIYYLEMDDVDTEDLKEEEKGIKSCLKDIALPYIIIVKGGKVLTELDKGDLVDADFDGAPIEYYDEENIEKLKDKLSKIIELK